MGGPTLSKPELFPDFIHSNDAGYHFMAEEIYLAVAQKIIQELNQNFTNKYVNNLMPDKVSEAIEQYRRENQSEGL